MARCSRMACPCTGRLAIGMPRSSDCEIARARAPGAPASRLARSPASGRDAGRHRTGQAARPTFVAVVVTVRPPSSSRVVDLQVQRPRPSGLRVQDVAHHHTVAGSVSPPSSSPSAPDHGSRCVPRARSASADDVLPPNSIRCRREAGSARGSAAGHARRCTSRLRRSRRAAAHPAVSYVRRPPPTSTTTTR